MSNRLFMTYAPVWLNNVPCGTVYVILENVMSKAIKSAHAMRGDPEWAHIDKRGHFHAFNDKQDLPTLSKYEREVADSDSPEEPIVAENYYVCVLCGEEIEPHWIPDLRAREVGSRVVLGQRLRFTVDGSTKLGTIPLDHPISVRVQLMGQDYFGFGLVTEHKTMAWKSAPATVHLSVQVDDPHIRLLSHRD